jgi:hypothetical protein
VRVFQDLSGAAAGLDLAWVQRYAHRMLSFSMRRFPRLSEESPDLMGRAMESTRDRAIILVEQVPRNENA